MFRNCLRHNSVVLLCLFFIFSSCHYREDQLSAKLDGQKDQVGGLGQRISQLEKDVRAREELVQDLLARIKQERADNGITIQDLRTELQALRGDTEEIAHSVELLKVDVQQVRSDFQKSDLDKLQSQDSAATDMAIYSKTLDIIIKEKDYNVGITKFRDFIKRFPNSSLADNALYWIGEGFYAQSEFRQAILEFQKVVDKYPKSDKVCAALLKQGVSFEQLDEEASAKIFFEETVSRCEGKSEGKEASKFLARYKK